MNACHTPKVNWADIDEQYDVFFNPLRPDREAQLMGIPDPPEWMLPRKAVTQPQKSQTSDHVAHINPFSALEVSALQQPASSQYSAPDSSPSSSSSAPPPSPSKTSQTGSSRPASAS